MAWWAVDRREEALFALSLPLIALPLVMVPVIDVMAAHRSGKPATVAIHSRLTADTEVIGVETFSPSMPFYLDRSVTLSSSTGRPFTSNSIIHAYDQLVETEPTLRPPDWWWRALAACTRPVIFVLRPSYRKASQVLEAAEVPLLFESRKLMIYGPCQVKTST